MIRRDVLTLLAGCAAASGGSGERFRFAVCNETFEGATFEAQCRLALETGYTGLENMPATLSADPARLSSPQRRECRATMERAGIAFTRLHAGMSAPAGLHLTTPDALVRERSWDYFRRIIDLSADLGTGSSTGFGLGQRR